MIQDKKVAIIGAGLSGLCLTKHINEIGCLAPTVFEKSNDFGGVWSNSSDRKVWDSLRLNVNQLSMSFSDFQYNDKFPSKEEIFPTNKKFYEYLNSYVENFNLKKYIKFNSDVLEIKKVGNDNNNCKWFVAWENTKDNINNFEIFDYVVICNGAFSKGSISNELKMKLKQFKGNIIHSENYRNPESLKGKNVVVLGTSFSGCEIASDISEQTSNCFQIGHENLYAVNRFQPNLNGNDMPWDMLFFIRNQCYEKAKNKTDQEIWEINKKLFLQFCPKQDLSKNSNSKIPVKITKENNPPTGFTISKTYIENVESGKIKTYTGDNYEINSINGNSITFSNDKGDSNTIHNIDSIILCSGYKMDFPFLEKEVLDDVSFDPTDSFLPICLYEHTFPSTFKTIAFLGCLKGIFITEVELYSRWISLVFSRVLEYPTNEKLNKGKNELLDLRKLKTRPQFPILDCVLHCDSIAKEIGCLPDFESMKISDPELYNKIWNGFFCQASYNLVGPGSNPKLAKEIINNYYENYQNFKNV